MENKDKAKVVLDFLNYIKDNIEKFKYKKSHVFTILLENDEDSLGIESFTYNDKSYIRITGNCGCIEAEFKNTDSLKVELLIAEIKEKYTISMFNYLNTMSHDSN